MRSARTLLAYSAPLSTIAINTAISGFEIFSPRRREKQIRHAIRPDVGCVSEGAIIKHKTELLVHTRLVNMVRTKNVMMRLAPDISNMLEPGVDVEICQMAT